MTDETTTREENVQQVRAAFEYLKTVADLIRHIDERSNGMGVPNGELYATLMSHMSYQTYTQLISKFQELKLISLSNNLIRWTGPKDFKGGVGR